MFVRNILATLSLSAVLLLPSPAFAVFQYPEAPVYTPNPALAQSASQTPAVPKHNTFGLVAPTYVPPGVNESGVYTTPVVPGSKGTGATYGLDWSIGSAGKSGCLVCHGNRNLVRVVGGQVVSMYVDTLALQGSAHAKLLCTDCHVDFTYKTPHANAADGQGWRAVAKSSCKSCHAAEFEEWARSAHSTVGSTSSSATVGSVNSSAPGKPRPVCGDCHQGHSIPAKNDAAGLEALRASAMTMCGRCHAKASADYGDYYHGAAYQRGAPDAPVCWQCHSTHLVLPSSNRESMTSAENLVTTCSQCHRNASQGFVQYAPLIHSQGALYQQNPIVSAVDTATAAIQSAFRGVLSAFRIGGS
jgi:5-methylcytosine-specific restriction endonuclease McrA